MIETAVSSTSFYKWPMFWRRPGRPVGVRYSARSDVGRVRTENEDSYGLFSHNEVAGQAEYLFVVADGMGGHARGEEASRIAVETVRDRFFSIPTEPAPERLLLAFQEANREIYRLAHNGAQHQTMGTTCTALALVQGRIYIVHVGDSRVYRINKHGIEQLTVDHTLVEGLRREGVLTAEEAAHHPRRHALTRAIGTDPDVQPDVLPSLPANRGDVYLLCSDGLDEVPASEIKRVVLSYEPDEACERLIRMANERGGKDNVTVLVVSVK
jgi:PPM family protein phosphatase